MPLSTDLALTLAATAGAAVTGALGFGFSTVTVPLVIAAVGNRELLPVIVVVEVFLNGYAAWLHRAVVPRVAPRVRPLLLGLIPGLVAGTVVLANADATGLLLLTFSVLLPVTLLQAWGVRRTARNERRTGIAVGAAVGALYAATTVSGPPLAAYFVNQNFERDELRAALAVIRTVAAVVAAGLYARAGLVDVTTASLALWVVPGVAVGLPAGILLARRVNGALFHRVCMAATAIVVARGLDKALRETGIMRADAPGWVLTGVVAVIGGVAVWRHVRRGPAAQRRPDASLAQEQS